MFSLIAPCLAVQWSGRHDIKPTFSTHMPWAGSNFISPFGLDAESRSSPIAGAILDLPGADQHAAGLATHLPRTRSFVFSFSPRLSPSSSLSRRFVDVFCALQPV